MLSEKIKETTKSNHLSVEKKLIIMIQSVKNEEQYAKLLNLFYSYFGGLELRINNHLDLSYLPDYEHRRKTKALVDDLTNLGVNIPELATKNDLPEINNHYQALGALYVIEGSTLGGMIICKMLAKQLGWKDYTRISFFNGYGDQTMSMWQKFKQSLDEPIYSEKHDIIIDAANQTFVKFGDWFDKNQSSLFIEADKEN